MSFAETLTEAGEAFRSGDIARAEGLYRQLQAEAPQTPAVNHMLGVIALQQGRLEEAVDMIARALAQRPEMGQAHQHLGMAQQRLGDRSAAEASYRRAVTLQGDLVMARTNLSTLLQQSGRLPEAITILREGLKLTPERFELQNNLGLALMNAGRPDAAANHLRKALAQAPGMSVVHRNLGNALAAAGHLDEAVERYRGALKIDPKDADATARLAMAECNRGNLAEAGALSARAAELSPRLALAHRAIALCRRAEGHLTEAEAAARVALDLGADSPDCYLDLAGILEDAGRRQDAIGVYDLLLARRPEHPAGRARRAQALLGLGRFTEAWSGPPAAAATLPAGQPPGLAQAPRWTGDAFADKTLRLLCEPGFGDSIQLVRYAPAVAGKGGRVVLACPAPLRRIFATLPGVDLADAADPAGPDELVAGLGDLPRLFATDLGSIPAPIPYLHIDEGLAGLWAERLAHLPRPRIGLCWRGGGDRDERRYLPLPVLEEAMTGIDASLVSLQRDSARRQIAAVKRVFDPKADPAYGAAAFEDFADTAALMANLDLIVSIDTANVHLAGAIGRPAYLLLPFAADWRWLEGRDDSPWYPSFRLIRQTGPGEWPGVVARLAQAMRLWRHSLG